MLIYDKEKLLMDKPRTKAFDKYIGTTQLQKYSPTRYICPMDIKNKPELRVSADLFDEFFEEFISCKFHHIAQIEFTIPGLREDGCNTFGLLVPKNDSLKWNTEETDTDVLVSVKFHMTGEQFGNQVESLKSYGIEERFIKLSEDEYVDMGEVNCECIIKLKFPKDTGWGIQSDRIKIAQDEDSPLEEANTISFCFVREPIPNTSEFGLFSFGILSTIDVFSDDARGVALAMENIVENGYITMNTNEDIMFPIPPENFDPATAKPEEYERPEVKRYQLDCIATVKRRNIWAAIDRSQHPFIKELLKLFIVNLYDYHKELYDESTNTISATVALLDEYLDSQDAKENFYTVLEPDMADEMRGLIEKELDSTDINVGETSKRLITEYFEKLSEYNEKLNSLAKSKGFDIDTSTMMVYIDGRNGAADEHSKQLIKELSEELVASEEHQAVQKQVHSITVSLALENGFIDKDKIDTMDETELKNLPEYRKLSLKLLSILSNFIGV